MKCERGARSTVLAITNAPIRIHMELKCQDLGNNPLSWEIFRNNHYLPVKSGSCHDSVFIQVNFWYIFSNFVYNTSMDTSQIVHNRSYEHYKHFLCKEKVITKRLDRISLRQQRARTVDTVCPQASQAGPKQKGGQGSAAFVSCRCIHTTCVCISPSGITEERVVSDFLEAKSCMLSSTCLCAKCKLTLPSSTSLR